ncbi:hypothetical protein ACLOJK_027222 [Asimina triloba]
MIIAKDSVQECCREDRIRIGSESCRAAKNAAGRQERCHALTGFGQDWQQESCSVCGVVYTGQMCDRHANRNAVLGNRNPVLKNRNPVWGINMNMTGQQMVPNRGWDRLWVVGPMAGRVSSRRLQPATVASSAAVPAAGRYSSSCWNWDEHLFDILLTGLDRLFTFSPEVGLTDQEMGCCWFRFPPSSVLCSNLPEQMDHYRPPTPNLFSIATVGEEDEDGSSESKDNILWVVGKADEDKRDEGEERKKMKWRRNNSRNLARLRPIPSFGGFMSVKAFMSSLTGSGLYN